MSKKDNGYTIKFLILIAAFLAAIIISVVLGRYAVSVDDFFKILWSRLPFTDPDQTWEPVTEKVLLEIRLPRVAAALLIGASLSMAGVCYQGMFRNPLVSPDILGASTGAGFGAALAILLGAGYFLISSMAFLFGISAVLLAYGTVVIDQSSGCEIHHHSNGNRNDTIDFYQMEIEPSDHRGRNVKIRWRQYYIAQADCRNLRDPADSGGGICFWNDWLDRTDYPASMQDDLRLRLSQIDSGDGAVWGDVPSCGRRCGEDGHHGRNTDWNTHVLPGSTTVPVPAYYGRRDEKVISYNNIIKVDHLTFSYDPSNAVLDDISFELGTGQLVAVLGPNGAGKSTLFKCLLGLLKRYQGSIYMEGRDIKELNRKQMAAIAAYIPQSETPVFNYSVMDSVLMGTTGMLSPLQAPGAEQIEIAKQALAYLDIEYMADRGINEISGGERQLALLARAMAQRARVLIMDEPTANLDYGNQQHVLRHIQKMAQNGYTILLSTHNPEHALQYATHVLAIKDHKILANGNAKTILNEELIKSIYGLDVKVLEVEVGGSIVRSCVPAKKTESPRESSR